MMANVYTRHFSDSAGTRRSRPVYIYIYTIKFSGLDDLGWDCCIARAGRVIDLGGPGCPWSCITGKVAHVGIEGGRHLIVY